MITRRFQTNTMILYMHTLTQDTTLMCIVSQYTHTPHSIHIIHILIDALYPPPSPPPPPLPPHTHTCAHTNSLQLLVVYAGKRQEPKMTRNQMSRRPLLPSTFLSLLRRTSRIGTRSRHPVDPDPCSHGSADSPIAY